MFGYPFDPDKDPKLLRLAHQFGDAFQNEFKPFGTVRVRVVREIRRHRPSFRPYNTAAKIPGKTEMFFNVLQLALNSK